MYYCRPVALAVDDPPAAPVVIVWWAVPVFPEVSCYTINTIFSCNTSITSCTCHSSDTNYTICTFMLMLWLKSQEKPVVPEVSCYTIITFFSCNTSITSCTSHSCDTNYAICTNPANVVTEITGETSCFCSISCFYNTRFSYRRLMREIVLSYTSLLH